MSWLEQYLRCVEGEADGALRSAVRERAVALGYPRCQFRPAEAVCAGTAAWDLFISRSDIHALVDARLELDAIEAARWRSAKAEAAA